MHLTLVTPPAAPPVSLDEAKAHLRYLKADQDGTVAALIAAATAHLEGRSGVLGRAFVTQTWELRRANFCPAIELPLPPLQSVVSVKYIDCNGTEVTIDPDDYVVDTGSMRGAIRPAWGAVWPATRGDVDGVRIRFVAGYGDAAAVPDPLKHAIKLLVGEWWTTREASGEPRAALPFAVDALTLPYRVWS